MASGLGPLIRRAADIVKGGAGISGSSIADARPAFSQIGWELYDAFHSEEGLLLVREQFAASVERESPPNGAPAVAIRLALGLSEFKAAPGSRKVSRGTRNALIDTAARAAARFAKDVAPHTLVSITTGDFDERAQVALIRAFALREKLPLSAVLARADRLIERGLLSDAAHWVVSLGLFEHVPNKKLLLPMIQKRLYNEISNYVSSAFNHVPASAASDGKQSEGPPAASDQTGVASAELSYGQDVVRFAVLHTAEPREGNNLKLAVRLLKRFRLDDRSMPRLRYLRRKNAIWGCVVHGSIDGFAEGLCTSDDPDTDARLRRYLCSQLARRLKSNATYSGLLIKYLKKFKLDTDPDYAKYVDAVKDEGKSKVVPATPPGVAAVDVPPRLRLDRGLIVFVDDLEGAKTAREWLLREGGAPVIGLDLEHVPDNVRGLLGSDVNGFTQLLQVACAERAFLFDLQALRQSAVRHMAWVRAGGGDSSVCGSDDENDAGSSQKNGDNAGDADDDEDSKGKDSNGAFFGEVEELLAEIFEDETRVKVGMDFLADMRKLASDFPNAPCFQAEVCSYLDLALLLPHVKAVDMANEEAKSGQEEKKTVSVQKDEQKDAQRDSREEKRRAGTKEAPAVDQAQKSAAQAPKSGAKSSRGRRREGRKDGKKTNKKRKSIGGLARLVRFALGRTLSKAEQMSNWSTRPLSDGQLEYAALDAHCQIAVLEGLKREAARPGSRIPKPSRFLRNVYP